MKCDNCKKEKDYEDLTGCIYYDDWLKEYQHGYLCDYCYEDVS
jgi:hypothetical protein